MQALLSRKSRFDTVILSPAAPSYGQKLDDTTTFKNFEERGSAFIRLAKTLFS